MSKAHFTNAGSVGKRKSERSPDYEFQQRYSHKAPAWHEITKSKQVCFLKCFVGIWLMDIGTQILKKNYANYAN